MPIATHRFMTVALALVAARLTGGCRGEDGVGTDSPSAGQTGSGSEPADPHTTAETVGVTVGATATTSGGPATTSDDSQAGTSGTSTESSTTALPDPPPVRCGDGIWHEGLEECDDGAGNLPPEQAATKCDACTNDCRRVNFCGHSTWLSWCEECDPELEGGAPCVPTCHLAKRRVFVTSLTYTGALGGASGAHLRCADRAQAAEAAWRGEGANPWTGKLFMAWISDGSPANCPAQVLDDADDPAPLPYYLPDDTFVVASIAELAISPPEHAIGVDEFGDPIGPVKEVWSNTDPKGHAVAQHSDCGQWLDDAAAPMPCDPQSFHCGGIGLVEVGAPVLNRWTINDSSPWRACAQKRRLYCFEQSEYQREAAKKPPSCPAPS